MKQMKAWIVHNNKEGKNCWFYMMLENGFCVGQDDCLDYNNALTHVWLNRKIVRKTFIEMKIEIKIVGIMHYDEIPEIKKKNKDKRNWNYFCKKFTKVYDQIEKEQK